MSADNILTAHLGDDHEPLGHNWVDNFLNRLNCNELQTHWSKPLDTQQGWALNPTNVKLWFDLVKEHIVDKNILPHNIYGMDESGFHPLIRVLNELLGEEEQRLNTNRAVRNKRMSQQLSPSVQMEVFFS